jgi:putative PIN family toxin of toxin-antitoxin system
MPSVPNGPRVRIVADTNTLISGSLWTGNPGRLLDAVKAGKITLLQTPQLWLEFVEVLERPKFKARLQFFRFTPVALADGLRKYVTWTTEAQILPPTALRDSKDLLVLAAASGSHADAIVTGDDDLLSLQSFEGIPIMKARDALLKLGLPVE